jgi:hypothetical protein
MLASRASRRLPVLEKQQAGDAIVFGHVPVADEYDSARRNQVDSLLASYWFAYLSLIQSISARSTLDKLEF